MRTNTVFISTPIGSKGGKATTMADLMKSVKTNFISPKKGEVLEGVITKLTSGEILVDVGAKTEAVVLEKDKNILRSLLSSLKVGDKVTVAVLNPESDMGNPVVSLRRFNDEKVWDKLQNLLKSKEEIEVTVDEGTRGGFLVSSGEGISGFLPNSQASFFENAESLIGKKIKVSVIELNRALKKIIFSQKGGGAEEFQKATKTLSKGQKVNAKITNIAPFGIFTLIETNDQKVEGFIHISEISWEKLAVIPDNFKSGESLEAQILNFDRDSKRVNLSLKALTHNPFEEKLKSYKEDQKVVGSVVKILTSGILVDLGEGVEGFIKKEKIPPTQSFKEGSSVNATVSEIDTKKQRLLLVPVLTEKPIGYR